MLFCILIIYCLMTLERQSLQFIFPPLKTALRLLKPGTLNPLSDGIRTRALAFGTSYENYERKMVGKSYFCFVKST